MPHINELLIVGNDLCVLVDHENGIRRDFLLGLEDRVLEFYFFLCLLAFGDVAHDVQRIGFVEFEQFRADFHREGSIVLAPVYTFESRLSYSA